MLLDDESRIRWYALTALINRIDNGDVNLYLKSGNRPATRGDIKKFAQKNIKLVDFPFDVEVNVDNEEINRTNENFELKNSNINEELIFNILSGILSASPMKMQSVKRSCELLAQRGINITEEKLISFLKREKAFKIYQNDVDDPIVTLS